MKIPPSLDKLIRFWWRFLHPYLYVIIPLVFFNMVPGVLLSLRPLVLAPVLGRVLPSDVAPASRFKDLSLDNLGVTLQSLVGDPGDDIAMAFLLSGVLYLIITFFISAIGGSVTLWSMAVRLRIMEDMINALHKHLMGLHIGFFLKQKVGDLISRFSMDLGKTAASLETVFSGMMRSTIQLILYGVMLFGSDALLTLQVIAVGSLHLLISHGLGSRVKLLTREAYDGVASLVAALQESFQNIRVIKSFSVERFDEKRIEYQARQLRKKNFDFMFARYLEDPIRLFADGIVIVAILYISYQAITQERMTMAGIALFFYMASQLVVPVSELSRHVLSIYGILGGFTRLVEMFETKAELQDGAREIKTFKKGFVFDNVSFQFNETPVLKNINLKIDKGESVGVVGASGGGKSTLIDLLLRLYDPNSGTILCDGVPLGEYMQTSYRSLFGVVSQECLLFNSSIRDNILLGRKYERDPLIEACRTANILDFIEQLPDGFETEVGDRGVRLSGGQRQRLAIARALYGHPEILILDEATSALDTVSEREVQVAIDKAIKGVTAIIIAHRLSTLRHVDKVIVLKNGKIEAIGKHDELLKESGVYNKLYKYQFE